MATKACPTPQFKAPMPDSKIAAERDVIAANGKGRHADLFAASHVIFGPGDGRFRQRFCDGKGRCAAARSWHRKQALDFTYIDNLIDALVLADKNWRRKMGASLGGKVWFITNGEPCRFGILSIRSLSNRVCRASGPDSVSNRLRRSDGGGKSEQLWEPAMDRKMASPVLRFAICARTTTFRSSGRGVIWAIPRGQHHRRNPPHRRVVAPKRRSSR